MGRKNRNQVVKAPYYLTKGEKFKNSQGNIQTESFAMVTESLLTSAAFMTLTPHRVKMLCVLCIKQLYGSHKPKDDFSDTHEFDGDEYFYMPLSVGVKVGLYSESDRKMYKDMKVLEKHGFVKLVYHGGGYGHAKSVYKFVGDWRTWVKDVV